MTLSDAELSQMRSELEALALPSTAVLYAGSYGTVGGGGGTITYTASATVACALAPRPPREIPEATRGNRTTPDVDRIVTLPANTTVSTEHRVEIGGTTFEVTDCQAPRSYEVARRIHVSEAL